MLRPPSLVQVWAEFLGSIVSATIILAVAQSYNKPDFQTVAFQALVDSLPFLATIVFALWPQEVSNLRGRWRVAILFGGLAWSSLLATRDYFNMQQGRKDQQTAITTAVDTANQHTDQQIGTLHGDMDSKFNDLGKTVTQGFSELKPPPPEFAALAFKFFDSSENAIDMHGGIERIFSVDFTATDITEKTFENGDIWVEICRDCKFAKEPSGFDKPNGMTEVMRHKAFNRLNPGVSMDKMTIDVVPPKGNFFEIAWRYSCETCGKQRDPQKFRINILPQYKLPSIKLN